jgi:hypothetical protein
MKAGFTVNLSLTMIMATWCTGPWAHQLKKQQLLIAAEKKIPSKADLKVELCQSKLLSEQVWLHELSLEAVLTCILGSTTRLDRNVVYLRQIVQVFKGIGLTGTS